MNNVVYKHHIPIYGIELRVTFSLPAFDKLVGGYPEEDASVPGVTAHYDGKLYVYVELEEDGGVDPHTLSHESYHVADFVADITQMETTRGASNEHMAYLIGYVSDLIMQSAYHEYQRAGL